MAENDKWLINDNVMTIFIEAFTVCLILLTTPPDFGILSFYQDAELHGFNVVNGNCMHDPGQQGNRFNNYNRRR